MRKLLQDRLAQELWLQHLTEHLLMQGMALSEASQHRLVLYHGMDVRTWPPGLSVLPGVPVLAKGVPQHSCHQHHGHSAVCQSTAGSSALLLPRGTLEGCHCCTCLHTQVSLFSLKSVIQLC